MPRKCADVGIATTEVISGNGPSNSTLTIPTVFLEGRQRGATRTVARDWAVSIRYRAAEMPIHIAEPPIPRVFHKHRSHPALDERTIKICNGCNVRYANNRGEAAFTLRIRIMVRFLRRRACSQGQALTFGGVAETFVALNRGPRVRTMEI